MLLSEQCRVKLTAGRVKSQGGVDGIADVITSGFSEVKVNLHMVWPRQRVDAIRLASTDEFALGISSRHNFPYGLTRGRTAGSLLS